MKLINRIKTILSIIILRITPANKKADFWRKKGLVIGSNSEIYEDVCFGSEPYLIEIGNNVRITRGVKFTTHDGGAWVLRKSKGLENATIFGKIKVGDNCHIGMNSIIMPNVTIGNNCIIGCGAIVTRDIPDNSIAVGVPARVINSIDNYYEKHKNSCDFTKNMEANELQKYLVEKYILSK